jgi:SAM-dependent methyltransferase
VHERAVAHGVGERVHTEVADLEQSLDMLGAADVVWASMVLHHVASPSDTLRQLHDVLRPGGLLAIVEFGRGARGSLPAGFDVGNDGFVDRHAAAVTAAVTEHLPPGAMTLDWPALLTAAGFTVVDRGELELSVPAPLDDTARRYVLQGLQMSQRMAVDRLDADDLATLAALASEDDAHSVLNRDDLTLDVDRSFFVARRD